MSNGVKIFPESAHAAAMAAAQSDTRPHREHPLLSPQSAAVVQQHMWAQRLLAPAPAPAVGACGAQCATLVVNALALSLPAAPSSGLSSRGRPLEQPAMMQQQAPPVSKTQWKAQVRPGCKRSQRRGHSRWASPCPVHVPPRTRPLFARRARAGNWAGNWADPIF